MLESLPSDVLKLIANGFLSPKDRLTLSSCNKQLRTALPMPLTLQIVNENCTRGIRQRFFVTPWKEVYLQNDNKTIYFHGDFLYANDTLQYGQEYIFWIFDYASPYGPAYLGRHMLQAYDGVLSPERLAPTISRQSKVDHCFHITWRMGAPNQTWEVIGDSRVVSSGDPVVCGDDVVGLMVSGKNPWKDEPDSCLRGLMSCVPDHPTNPVPNWMTLVTSSQEQKNGFNESVEWGSYEKLQLLHTRPQDPMTWAAMSRIHLQSLFFAAVPDVCEMGLWFLYAPWKDIRRTHHEDEIVEFQFWIEHGIMFFRATGVSFSLAIPIHIDDADEGKYDGLTGTSWAVWPIQDLGLGKRWECMAAYMLTILDHRNNPHFTGGLLERVLDEFSVYISDEEFSYRESSQTIHLKMKDESIRTTKDDGTPLSLPRDPSQLWKFASVRWGLYE